MITYNHEAYIEKALIGVLNQQTKFSYVLIIAEDCSTDHTRIMCEKYEKAYPSAAKLLDSSENHGMQKNFMRAFAECTGKYIALCEGDDYWTDPYKLQKQVDFLEANPDYAICFHPVVVKDENSGEMIEDYLTHEVPNTTTIENLACLGNYMHTPSVVFRNRGSLPSYFNQLAAGDYPLHLYNAEQGKIFKMTDIMAVYRVHNRSSWSSKDLIYRQKRNVEDLAVLRGIYTNPSIHKNLTTQYANVCLATFETLMVTQQHDHAEFYLNETFKANSHLVFKSYHKLFERVKELDQPKDFHWLLTKILSRIKRFLTMKSRNSQP